MPAIMYEERTYTPEAAALEVDVTPGPQPGTVSVCVRGDVDFDNAATLRTALLAALVSHRGSLLVDLSQVSFCDCAGLHTLLTARTASRRAGRSLHITASGRPVERLLQLTDTRDLLT
ncbi:MULTISPECIES: STAS domain-containing protein [Streptomyces]|uniref:STAS domain-containing protein n=1 Tax=Streptomyces TaxID=1883 RepID=UPI0006B014B1|nr:MULTISPECIES: STAS domain-containing protein [unclassified Streptomyces]